jgi:nicotinamidase/pyrazinamidase
LLPAIAHLNHFAAAHGIPLISTADSHSENDPEFQSWPPHCVAGTAGQVKPAATLLENRSTLGSRPGSAIELAGQIVVEKQALDVFTNPNFGALLDRLAGDRYVVYGVATDYCVRCAVLGLLGAGKRVAVVTDAIAAVKPETGARTLHEFAAQGGSLTTVGDVTK